MRDESARPPAAVRYEVVLPWPLQAPAAPWGAACGVSVDAHDRVFFCNRAAPQVQVYDPQGRRLGTWPDFPVAQPHHVRVDPEGNVWLADFGLHTVRKFTPEGRLLLSLGSAGQAGCDATHFDKPTDVATGPDSSLYVADGYGNARVVQFDRHGRYVRAWGGRGEEPGQFVLPHAIAADAGGRVYVADRNSARIQVFEAAGRLLDVWAGLIMPWGIVAGADGHLWVCGSSAQLDPATGKLQVDPPDQYVLKLTAAGRIAARWDFPKGQDGQERPGELNWVHCIALDSTGALYLGDIQGKRLQRFVPTCA